MHRLHQFNSTQPTRRSDCRRRTATAAAYGRPAGRALSQSQSPRAGTPRAHLHVFTASACYWLPASTIQLISILYSLQQANSTILCHCTLVLINLLPLFLAVLTAIKTSMDGKGDRMEDGWKRAKNDTENVN